MPRKTAFVLVCPGLVCELCLSTKIVHRSPLVSVEGT